MSAAFDWWSVKGQARAARVIGRWAGRRKGSLKVLTVGVERWAKGRVAANGVTSHGVLEDAAVDAMRAAGELVPMMPTTLTLRSGVIENMRARKRGATRKPQHRSPWSPL